MDISIGSGVFMNNQGGTPVEIVNDLTSGGIEKALSAEMGKQLNNTKLDKIEGKGLSTNDYTTEEKKKLAGLESSKFKGEFLSVNALSTITGEVGAYAYVDAGAGENTKKYIWDSTDNTWHQQASADAQMTPAQIKESYESNGDTNAFTNDEKAAVQSILDDQSLSVFYAAVDGALAIGKSGINNVYGRNALATGSGTVAVGEGSFTQGYQTNAGAFGAHAEGMRTNAYNKNMHVDGCGNKYEGGEETPARDNLIAVTGWGMQDEWENRRNVRTLDKQGNQYVAGKLYVGEGVEGAEPTIGEVTTYENCKKVATTEYVDNIFKTPATESNFGTIKAWVDNDGYLNINTDEN